MCTNPTQTGLSTDHPLDTRELSISPLHARALSNIYTTMDKDLFILKDPSWKTSPLPPHECKKQGKRHYRRTSCAVWPGEKSINMGPSQYTTSPFLVLATQKLQARQLCEMPSQDADTFPRVLVKKTEHSDGPVHPQHGDFRDDSLLRCAKYGMPCSSSTISAHPKRQPIVGAGLVGEMRLIQADTKITKDEFPEPFCKLPDEQFIAWFVRNMKMLGWGAWAAECEALQVLRRTEAKRVGEATLLLREIEEAGCDGWEDERSRAYAKDIRGVLAEIERRRKEKRGEKVRRARERKRRAEEERKCAETRSIAETMTEGGHGKKGRYPVQRGKLMTWIKKFFSWR